MEDGVTLDVPSFSYLYFLLLWISAQYKWHRHGFLPHLEISQVEVELPRTPDPPNGYDTVLIGCGTYGFVRLCKLKGLFDSFLFFSTLVRDYAAQGVCT
jgi:hypothetical protein